MEPPGDALPTDDGRDRGRGLHAVCLLVVRSLEGARRLLDDRPEMALATLERWLADEDGPAELHDAMELMVQATCEDREAVTATRCVLWAMRLNVVDPWRARDVARRVVAGAVEVLVALGEEPGAAASQVDAAYRAGVAEGRRLRGAAVDTAGA